eukprot:1395025-Rhodomonas_salina.1
MVWRALRIRSCCSILSPVNWYTLMAYPTDQLATTLTTCTLPRQRAASAFPRQQVVSGRASRLGCMSL